jgi:hypothetical protein
MDGGRLAEEQRACRSWLRSSMNGDVPNLCGTKEKNCVCPIGDAWFATLCQLMYLFAHCRDPEMLEVGIMLQFLVLCYGYLGDGMDNAAAVLLDINDGPSPLQIDGNLNCLKSHDVMD